MSEAARLSVGDVAPDFTLPDQDGEQVALKSFRGGSLLLYFYPAAMTPGCTKEAGDFQASLDDFAAAGWSIIGVSPDPPAKLVEFREQQGLTFPLLSDADKSVMTAYGAYGEKKLYGRTVVGVIRSTFGIDAEGTITHAQYGVRATGHVAKLRQTLEV